jgi:hypothetical protein
MPIIRVELTSESFRRLTELAVEERRPIPWQAEVLLLRALGLPAPPPLGIHALQAADFPEEPHPQEVPCAAE